MADKDTSHLSVEQLEEIIDILADGLDFYANPETYFALLVAADPPCGEFVNDYSDDHGHPQLDGVRYGKKAREAIRKVEEIIDKFSKDGVWREDRLASLTERARALALKFCDQLGCTDDYGQPFPDDVERTTNDLAAALQSEREAAAPEARRAVISDAAQVMIGLGKLYQAEVGFDTGYRMACERGEKEIRALASPPTPQEETR